MSRNLNILLIPAITLSLSSCIPITAAYLIDKYNNEETPPINEDYCKRKEPIIYCKRN